MFIWLLDHYCLGATKETRAVLFFSTLSLVQLQQVSRITEVSTVFKQRPWSWLVECTAVETENMANYTRFSQLGLTLR